MSNQNVRCGSALIIIVLVMGAGVATACASAGEPTGLTPRWPLFALGGAALAVGLVAMGLRHSWSHLSLRLRLLRGVGVAVASLGIFFAMYGLTEAPPLPSTAGEFVWWTSLEEAEKTARALEKPLMVDFTADWCVACKELEAEVFHHPRVRTRLAEEFISVKIDFDRALEANDTLLSRFAVHGLPTVIFVSSAGETLRGPSFEGKIGVDDFLERLDAVHSGAAIDEGARGRLERNLAEGSLWSVLLLVFIAGLLSSLTPCVYPLIPITISVFGARQAESRWQSFTLSLTYVWGIAITYATMGLIAASVGSVFGAALQSPWLIFGVALLFFVLGLSSLGVMDFRLPGNLQTKLSQTGGAGYAGALIMGLVAGVIAAPCVGPIVAGILLYVAQQQDLMLGTVLLMVFALGMGMLFLVLGTFSSLIHRLPRAGGWMEGVKAVFGVVFIGLAMYYLRFVVPGIREATDALWLLLG
ncbi:MAG: cytochrome c biogenesis protein CcdA [Bradymonadaceae bacterium]